MYIVYANKTFAHTAEGGKWANFTWISEKSQEAREEGPPEGGEDPRADVDDCTPWWRRQRRV
jgi:hypothetical protein